MWRRAGTERQGIGGFRRCWGIIGLLVLITAVFCAGQAATQERPLELTEAERRWLEAHPTVRVGFDPGYAPYSFISTSGEITGLAPDLFQLLSGITGITFETPVLGSWQAIMDGARSGGLDVVATIVRTPEREAFLGFTEILVPTPLVIMARSGDFRILDPQSLNGRTVALVSGYSSSERVLREHPGVIPKFVGSPLEGLQAVAVGTADAYVGVLGVNVHLARNHGLTNLRIAAQYDLDGFGQRIGVRKDWPELRSILEKAMSRIDPGERTRIFDRWVPTLEMVLEGESQARFQLTAEEQAWLDEKDPIRIGTMHAWPPVDYAGPDGIPKGIGAGFLRAIDRRLGGRIEIVSGPWEEIYADVMDGRLDGIAGITPTEGRREIFHFTRPYLIVPHAIFARVDQESITGLADLAGQRVAIERGFFIGDIILTRFPDIELLEYDTTGDALGAVSRGEADAYAGNRAAANFIIRNELLSDLKEHAKIAETKSVNAFGIAIDQPVLRDIFQKALDNITALERRILLGGWVATEDGRPRFSLTEEERDWLAAHPVIRVAGDRAFRPIEYIAANGNYEGVAPDYLSLLSALLEVKFVYDTTASWSEAVNRLRNRELDMFAAAVPTDSRRLFADFTPPNLHLPAMIFSRQGGFAATSMDALEGHSVAVVRDYAITEFLLKDHPEISFVMVPSVTDGLKLLASKRVDAYIGSILVTGHTIRENGLTNLFVTGPTPYGVNLSMAARSDWPVLARILRKALGSISEEEQAEIISKWIGVRIKEPPDFLLLLNISIVFVIVLLGAILWIWLLRSKTVAQAGQLADRNFELAKEVEERRRAEIVARAANERKTEFLGNISHELKTPLNGVVGYAEMIELGLETGWPKKKVLEYFPALYSASDQLKGLIDNVLKIASFEKHTANLEEDDVPFDDLVGILKSFFEEQIEANNRAVRWPRKMPVTLRVDRAGYLDVLAGLLDNALKFSDPIAPVTVEATINDNGEFIVSVRDKGRGIGANQLENILEPFVRGDGVFVRSSKGAGLGLTLAKRLISAHGGRLEITSEPDVGTIAKAILPPDRVVADET